MLAWSGYSEAKSRLWLFTHSNTEQQRKYSGMLSSCTSARSLLFWHVFVKALIPVNKIITAIFSKSILTFTFLSLTWLRMQKSANEQSVTAQKGRSIHFCVANAKSHQQLLQATEPGSGMGIHLLWLFGEWGEREKKKARTFCTDTETTWQWYWNHIRVPQEHPQQCEPIVLRDDSGIANSAKAVSDC